MKKLLFAAIFILTGLNAFSQNAFIEQLTGEVEIKHPGEGSFKGANKGDTVFQDTVISTGFKSYAIIKAGSTTITARPLTQLTLSEIQKSGETETLNVDLHIGRVRVDVKPPSGTKAATTFNGPTTSASVRGTSFEFDTDNLYVREGAVIYTGNRGQDIIVRAGENSRLKESGQVAYPRDARDMDLMPPSPVGISAGDTPVTGPVVITGTNFKLGLEFKQ
ncbi:MAG: FecR family protein [Treponema sp.]|jgi:hypothetical protein|nr:FecR family protein [Treponema sp.]